MTYSSSSSNVPRRWLGASRHTRARRFFAVLLLGVIVAASYPSSAPRDTSASIALSPRLVPASSLAGGERDGQCGASGGRYDIGWPHADSSDTDGHCEGDVANYQGAVAWAITQVNARLDECERVRMFLLYEASIFEWTGWVEGEYWLNAGTRGTRIGLHWPWMDSAWLLVHEGSIGLQNAGEVESAMLADKCASHPAAAPQSPPQPTIVRAAPPQQPVELEREAALRYALANGFQLPAGTVLATETMADSSRPRTTATRMQFRERDAGALAAALGTNTQRGSALSLVHCRKLVCVGASDQRVLVISDPEFTPQNKTVVGLSLYGKDSAGNDELSGAVAIVERRETGWVGVSYTLKPFTVRPRLPPG